MLEQAGKNFETEQEQDGDKMKMTETNENRLKYPSKGSKNEEEARILYILDRLRDYRDSDDAASRCLMEVAKTNNKMAWLILGLINLEKEAYKSFGACLRNVIGGSEPEELISEISKTVEHLEPYLSRTYFEISDFLDGYKLND